MARRRRTKRSNRRLPTSHFSTPSSNITIARLHQLLGVTQYEPELYSIPVKFSKPQALEYKKSSQLAKSVFPKTYGVQQAVTPSQAAALPICASRAQRAEVMHATGQAGKRGQKRPNWTSKSKVRC